MEKVKKNIQVVAAIIFEGSSVYCFRKGDNKLKYLENKFEFAGGKIEANENKRQALEREILEELNIDIIVNDELLVINHEYPDFKLTMYCFSCVISKGTIKLSEHKEFILQDICRLNDLDWLPADIPAVEYLMENF